MVLKIFSSSSRMNSLQNCLHDSWYSSDLIDFLQISSIYVCRDLAKVSKWIWALEFIWNCSSIMFFWISLNFQRFSFALTMIWSNIYFVYFTFSSYSSCSLLISFILLNLFIFLSIVAYTESCENTWRVNSSYIDFFNFIFRVRTFSRIYRLERRSLCRTLYFSSMTFCSDIFFSDSPKLIMNMSWLNLLIRFLCWFRKV